MRSWTSWDEPDRQVAVIHWTERDIAVVFPLHWAARRSLPAMARRARERIRELEGKTDRTLAPGSVLLAFSAHEDRAPEQIIDPDVPKNILPVLGA